MLPRTSMEWDPSIQNMEDYWFRRPDMLLKGYDLRLSHMVKQYLLINNGMHLQNTITIPVIMNFYYGRYFDEHQQAQ